MPYRNYDREKQYKKDQRLAHRKWILDLMGGKCVRCPFNDYRALQIDHVHGGGGLEEKTVGKGIKYLRHVARSFTGNEGRYQILCANCNVIKKFENNEHPFAKRNK